MYMKLRQEKICEKCSKKFTCPIRSCGTQYTCSITNWNRRRFCSHRCANETTTKLSGLSKRGKCSESTRIQLQLLAEGRKGVKREPFSDEWKENMRKSHKGISSANKGKKFPERTGSNHPNWIQDRTQLQRYADANKDRRSSAYRFWRKQVWERDNYKCRIDNSVCNGRLEAHHILGYTEHVELRYEINNGITLCHAHHPKGRAEEKRLVPTFKELVSVSKATI